jgi:multidrug efflux pump subunit AcrB
MSLMGLVSSALRRPVTVLVAIVGVALVAGLAITRMQRDVFPDLGVPTIYVSQPYGGMDPAQMEGFITNYYEYHFLYINGIEHVESKNVQGIALIKLQFHPGTNMAQALAETVSYVNRSRAFMPPGTIPPFIMRFDAGSVSVGSLVMSSDDPNVQVKDMQDAGLFKVRPLFSTLPGVSAPPPFGGSPRTIVITVDPDKLRAYHMNPDEVVAAIGHGNVISPSGNVRIGNEMPIVPVNSVAPDVKQLEAVPIRSDGTKTVFVRDVGTVADSADTQVGYALVNGRRTVYIPVTKRADASTLTVVNLVKENLPKFQAVVPPGVKVTYEFDQSPYVTRSIRGLTEEGLLGAGLTGLMVLLFLRDWRSVIVVVLNIPLALLAAVVALWFSGQTVNLMTLGGLAMAVGILVDEATVEVENIHTQFAHSPNIAVAVRAGNHLTAGPRLLSMLCVLAVFIPALFMQGAAKSLFVPMSLAVGFAMVASYVLSSTFVPVMSVWLLRHQHGDQTRHSIFDHLKRAYAGFSSAIVAMRWLIVPAYLAGAVLAIFVLYKSVGREIFPVVDAGQFALRLRAPAGTRLEETEQTLLKALDVIKNQVGKDNVALTLGYCGVQAGAYPVNVIHLWTSGSEEAYVQVQLKQGAARVADLKETLRKKLPEALPGVRLSFEPSDIVSKVMSFGSLTPVEVAVTGPDLAANRQYADKLKAAMSKIDSLRDLQYVQELDYPAIKVNLDRQRAGVMGVTAEQAARALAIGTSSSRYTASNFWADPKTGIGYQVQVMTPIQRMDSIEELKNIPVAMRGGDQQLTLRQVADVNPGTVLGEYDRYNMQRMLTLGANVAGEDLGRVADRVDQAIKEVGKPPTNVKDAVVRGQIAPMKELFSGLASGLGVAVIVIFLLLAASFQSIRLALAVLLTAPAVIVGVGAALFLTKTTLNIQSFMGAIMAIGVAVANSILLITFAERARVEEGRPVKAAAVEGAAGRLRPILMTSFAMIAGMIPMALGTGQGGEQTSPLGRAVIGGLVGATLATLVVLPAIFAMLQGEKTRKTASIDPEDPNSPYYHDQEQGEEAGNGHSAPVAQASRL